MRRAGDPRRELARRGEQLAAEHLQRRGFELLQRNARTRFGEIDLIAYDGAVLAFVEVKTRRLPAERAAAERDPLAGLRPRQRARIRRLAVAWLAEHARARPRAAELRFDAIGIVLDARGALARLEHLEGAW